MAWSIFSLPNGNLVAVAWAFELLNALGAPDSAGNVQFIYNWEMSEGGGGAYNPLNQGPVPGQPQLTTTGEQYGGGAADFASWEAGIQGAVAYLNMPNYAAVKQGLLQDAPDAAKQALWASPWAASHYGYGADWNTSAFPQASPSDLSSVATAVGLGAVSGAPGSPPGTSSAQVALGANPGGVNTLSTPPSINDPAALDNWIRANQPSFGWMLDIPELKPIIEKGISAGETQQLLYQVEQTTWWKTTSAAYKTFLQNQATNPADYNFQIQGSTASQTLANIMNDAAAAGVTLTAEQGQQLALDSLKYGWDQKQITAAIGTLVTSANAQTVDQQLRQTANQYYQSLTPDALNSWAENIAGGTQTMQQFQAQMAQDAAMKWTGYAPQLQSGYTMQQLTDSLRNNVAKTLEVDPTSIDFINNPLYSKILDFVPPNSPNGVHRVMTDSEAQQYIKSTPQLGYSKTQQARDQGTQASQAILQALGKVGP